MEQAAFAFLVLRLRANGIRPVKARHGPEREPVEGFRGHHPTPKVVARTYPEIA